MGALHSWLLTLKTAAGQPVEDATITIDGGMPEHGHGLPTSPAVSAHLGAGKYRVEGVKFTMSGWWELRFAITARGRQRQCRVQREAVAMARSHFRAWPMVVR